LNLFYWVFRRKTNVWKSIVFIISIVGLSFFVYFANYALLYGSGTLTSFNLNNNVNTYNIWGLVFNIGFVIYGITSFTYLILKKEI